jgi:hypothetical protein
MGNPDGSIAFGEPRFRRGTAWPACLILGGDRDDRGVGYLCMR